MANTENPIREAEKQPTIEGGFNGSGTESGQVQLNLTPEEARLEEIKRQEENLAKEKKALSKQLRSIKSNPAKAKEETAKAKLGDFVPYQLKSGEVVKKKASYIRQNRMISYKRVEEFMELIRQGKYLDDYPIIVMDAAKFHKSHSGIDIVDAFGRPIPEDEFSDYYVYLDGQHRGQAHIILYNMGEVQCIPGVVEKESIGDVAQFLRSINPKGSWSNSDVALVCRLCVKGKYKPLMEEIEILVRQGYNRSTASQIFCGKPLTSKQFNTLVAGEKLKNDVPFNLDKGREFIACCTKAGITAKFLTKRHFIEGYLDFKTTKGESVAEAVLHKLPTFDEDTLKAIKGKDDFVKHLDEIYNSFSK